MKLPSGQGIGVVVPEASVDGVPSEARRQGSWAAQRWGRFVEQIADGAKLVDGLDYASSGQTKRLDIGPGLIEASVQGRLPRAYVTRIELPKFSDEQWAQVIGAMADSAIYSAKLLSGEVPSNIEDLFGPLGLRLFPSESTDAVTQCTCGEGGPWCKHACCVAHLFASRLTADPFLMFVVRGLDTEDLRERLRQKRVVQGAASGSVPVYAQRVPGAADQVSRPLDQCLHRFWDAGEELSKIDLPVAPPPVSHPLLRRLGSSPFQNAQFPLVGLLASCYETISEEAIRGTEQQASPEAEEDPSESRTEDNGEV